MDETGIDDIAFAAQLQEAQEVADACERAVTSILVNTTSEVRLDAIELLVDRLRRDPSGARLSIRADAAAVNADVNAPAGSAPIVPITPLDTTKP